MRNKRRLAELIEKLGAQRSEETDGSSQLTASENGSAADRKGSSEKGTDESFQNNPQVTPVIHDGQENGFGEDKSEYDRAAFMLGSAMLDRIGIPEGIHPIAVVATLLERMDSEEASGSISDAENDEAIENDEYAENPENAENIENSENGEKTALNRAVRAYGRDAALPRPMRGSMGQAPETDYYGMSSEDFRNLREKIKRASRDGRRIRI